MQIATVARDASSFGGGVLNVARPLHENLLRRGVDCAFVYGNPPTAPLQNSYCAGLRGQKFRELPDGVMRSVVHIHNIWTSFEYWAFREARRRQARIVMSPHGALEPWAFHHKGAKKRLAWWAYQKRVLQAADLIIVNSLQERTSLRSLGLKPPIATIPNGVDLQGFPKTEGERERIVLFFSRIVPKKGVPDLIEAWSALDDRKGYRLQICGHGDAPYMEEIKQRIASCNAKDVEILAPVFGSARWSVFTTASVYVLPTYSENFGITIAEALTAGLPVITTKATPWGGLTSDGLGWIVDNDILQLRDALQAAINLSPVVMSDMRQRAQIYAGQRFGWETIAEQYVETYDWLSNPSKATPAWIG